MPDYPDTYDIAIECDEGRFYHLRVRTEEGWHDFPLPTNVAEDLYDTVKREIGPWLHERDQARAEFRCSPSDVDESGGLAEIWREELGPKHPDFHSVHADIWDSRAGK